MLPTEFSINIVHNFLIGSHKRIEIHEELPLEIAEDTFQAVLLNLFSELSLKNYMLWIGIINNLKVCPKLV